MKKSGFKLDLAKLKKRLLGLQNMNMDAFKLELLDYVRKSLATAVKLTPARDKALIEQNQHFEYQKRVNMIPTSHDLVLPSLRVSNSGTHWVYHGTRWYNVTDWHVPDDVWGAYQELLQERARRMQTQERKFIQERAQARFLYKKSWTQIGDSLGFGVQAGGHIKSSYTRRKPAKEPPRAYGQIRGGKQVLSVAIYNPLLTTPSRYIKFDASDILREATMQHREQFNRSIKRRMLQLIRK